MDLLQHLNRRLTFWYRGQICNFSKNKCFEPKRHTKTKDSSFFDRNRSSLSVCIWHRWMVQELGCKLKMVVNLLLLWHFSSVCSLSWHTFAICDTKWGVAHHRLQNPTWPRCVQHQGNDPKSIFLVIWLLLSLLSLFFCVHLLVVNNPNKKTIK